MNAVIDCRVVDSREALHDTLSRELRLPAWYGRNLDALYDYLTGLAEPTRVRLTHTDQLYRALGPYGESLISVLRDAAAENGRFRFTTEP